MPDRPTNPAAHPPAWSPPRRTSPAASRTAGDPRPSAAGLAAAASQTIPDVIAPGLTVLFCGINPGLYSAATGHHFARPGNRFWPALHQSGFTPRQLRPSEQDELLALGLGITNVAARATARADGLDRQELQAGGQALRAKVLSSRPRWLAVLGITAYRLAFADRGAQIGPQRAMIGDTRLWALPNPSGLNASWSAARIAAAFGELHAAAGDL